MYQSVESGGEKKILEELPVASSRQTEIEYLNGRLQLDEVQSGPLRAMYDAMNALMDTIIKMCENNLAFPIYANSLFLYKERSYRLNFHLGNFVVRAEHAYELRISVQPADAQPLSEIKNEKSSNSNVNFYPTELVYVSFWVLHESEGARMVLSLAAAQEYAPKYFTQSIFRLSHEYMRFLQQLLHRVESPFYLIRHITDYSTQRGEDFIDPGSKPTHWASAIATELGFTQVDGKGLVFTYEYK